MHESRSAIFHQTHTHCIETEEGIVWEFTCHQCSYQARYGLKPGRSGQKLQILHPGDAAIRHISGQAAVVPGAPELNEAWLTPELRQQIETILRRCNF